MIISSNMEHSSYWIYLLFGFICWISCPNLAIATKVLLAVTSSPAPRLLPGRPAHVTCQLVPAAGDEHATSGRWSDPTAAAASLRLAPVASEDGRRTATGAVCSMTWSLRPQGSQVTLSQAELLQSPGIQVSTWVQPGTTLPRQSMLNIEQASPDMEGVVTCTIQCGRNRMSQSITLTTANGTHIAGMSPPPPVATETDTSHSMSNRDDPMCSRMYHCIGTDRATTTMAGIIALLVIIGIAVLGCAVAMGHTKKVCCCLSALDPLGPVTGLAAADPDLDDTSFHQLSPSGGSRQEKDDEPPRYEDVVFTAPTPRPSGPRVFGVVFSLRRGSMLAQPIRQSGSSSNLRQPSSDTSSSSSTTAQLTSQQQTAEHRASAQPEEDPLLTRTPPEEDPLLTGTPPLTRRSSGGTNGGSSHHPTSLRRSPSTTSWTQLLPSYFQVLKDWAARGIFFNRSKLTDPPPRYEDVELAMERSRPNVANMDCGVRCLEKQACAEKELLCSQDCRNGRDDISGRDGALNGNSVNVVFELGDLCGPVAHV